DQRELQDGSGIDLADRQAPAAQAANLNRRLVVTHERARRRSAQGLVWRLIFSRSIHDQDCIVPRPAGHQPGYSASSSSLMTLAMATNSWPDSSRITRTPVVALPCREISRHAMRITCPSDAIKNISFSGFTTAAPATKPRRGVSSTVF